MPFKQWRCNGSGYDETNPFLTFRKYLWNDNNDLVWILIVNSSRKFFYLFASRTKDHPFLTTPIPVLSRQTWKDMQFNFYTAIQPIASYTSHSFCKRYRKLTFTFKFKATFFQNISTLTGAVVKTRCIDTNGCISTYVWHRVFALVNIWNWLEVNYTIHRGHWFAHLM